MKLVIVGTREDVAGFALAGVDGAESPNEETLLIVSHDLECGNASCRCRIKAATGVAALHIAVVLPPTPSRS